MNAVDYPRALDAVWSIISRTNKYIDETAPWVLAKDDAKRDELAAVMAHLAASLRVVAHLIHLFMVFSEFFFDNTCQISIKCCDIFNVGWNIATEIFINHGNCAVKKVSKVICQLIIDTSNVIFRREGSI